MLSERFRLILPDLKRLGIGALVALGGALATYLETTIPGVNFGQYTFIVVSLNSVLVNAIRLFVTQTTYKQ